MITESILDVFKGTVQFILNLLPNIPSFPDGILNGINYLQNIASGVMGLVSYLLTPPVVIFVFTAVIILLNFDNVYKLASWFWHKVRGG